MALLSSEDVPQGPPLAEGEACQTGPLWTNCDGRPVIVYDHASSALYGDVDSATQEFALQVSDVAIVFSYNRVTYDILPTKVDSTSLAFVIDMVCCNSSDEERQNILDTIEERILYRLFSQQSFTDAQTGDVLTSIFSNFVKNEMVKIETQEEADIGYTIRRAILTIRVNECIKPLACNTIPLCFDFSALPKPPRDC